MPTLVTFQPKRIDANNWLPKTPVHFIYSQHLDSWDGCDDEIMEEMPDLRTYLAQRSVCRAPNNNTMPEIAISHCYPLLSFAQERHLFRRMNFCKKRLNEMADKRLKLTHRHNNGPKSANLTNQMLAYYTHIMDDQSVLVESNLRLVINMVKKKARSSNQLSELIADGNTSLLRAVNGFDYARGFKFSTYAGWAIIKNTSRFLKESRIYDSRYHTDCEQALNDAMDTSMPPDPDQPHIINMSQRYLEVLENREREIVRHRAGMCGLSPGGRDNWTLREVGAKFGITKERVRQIFNKAMIKMVESAQLAGN